MPLMMKNTRQTYKAADDDVGTIILIMYDVKLLLPNLFVGQTVVHSVDFLTIDDLLATLGLVA